MKRFDRLTTVIVIISVFAEWSMDLYILYSTI